MDVIVCVKQVLVNIEIVMDEETGTLITEGKK